MSRISDSFRQGSIATVATIDTLLDTWLDAAEARVTAESSASTRAVLSASINVPTEDASGNSYTHKVSITFDSGTKAAGSAVTAAKAAITALSTAASSLISASEYDDLTGLKNVSASASINLSN